MPKSASTVIGVLPDCLLRDSETFTTRVVCWEDPLNFGKPSSAASNSRRRSSFISADIVDSSYSRAIVALQGLLRPVEIEIRIGNQQMVQGKLLLRISGRIEGTDVRQGAILHSRPDRSTR